MKKFLILIAALFLLVGCKTPPIENHTITFNNGLSNEVLSLPPGRTIIIPDDPTREGYTFEWWYLDENYSTPLELSFIPSSSLTIFAKWIPEEYTIVFNSNGGSTYSPLQVKRDQFLPNTYNPTRANYSFAGWFTDSDFQTPFSFTTGITSNLNLFANWLEIIHPLIDLEDYVVDYIVTNLGETTDSMRINYQARNTKTYLEYTLAPDLDFINSIRLNPTMVYFESLSEAMEIPFLGRNICRVEINDLIKGKTYLYRINQGDGSYSDTYSFTTAVTEQTTFLFMTDIHYYDGFDGAEVSEDVIKAALNYNPKIDFILNTGDTVDTGGNADDWEKYFTHAVSLKTLPVVGIPGNHEHYFIGDMKNKIFSSYFNFPLNGIDSYKGTSYFFIHNDTLFIQVDTDSPYNQGLQLAWIEETIINNPTKFIIVGTHAPVNETWSTDYNRPFMAIMEKYAVDLVLAGHYHSQDYALTYLDMAPTNPYLGVAYFRGAGGGIKGAGDAEPKDFAKGYIISVKSDYIEIQTINGNGVLGSKHTITNKKIAPFGEASKEEIMNSIDYVADLANEKITFQWSDLAYKNVKELRIKQAYREQETYTTILPTPGYTSYTFASLKANLDHMYTIEVVFKDGQRQEKEFTLNLSGGMNLKSTVTQTTINLSFALPTGDNLTNIKRYEVYLDGVLIKTVNAKDDNFQAINSLSIDNLTKNTTYEVVIKTIGRYGFMYSDRASLSTLP